MIGLHSMKNCWLFVLLLCYTGIGLSQTETKLTASDGSVEAYFGCSVSVDGDTAIIGAYGTPTVSAYVFTRDTGGSWSEQLALPASGASTGDMFGYSVAIDDDTVIVGASSDDVGDITPGSVYVFTRDAGGSWSEQAKLTASDAADHDMFGNAVSLDVDTAVIGARSDDDAGDVSGSAYVFVRDLGGSWSEQAKLTASDALSEDRFGWSVSINGDTAIVGVPAKNAGSGSVYVFVRDAGGSWSEQAKLTASDAAPGAGFGWSVSLYGDTAAIGATGTDISGAAYVFTRDAAGSWSEQAKLTASDASGYVYFGNSVSAGPDIAVVGAPLWSGSAYVFTRDAGGSWSEQVKLIAPDLEENDLFGHSVSVDGSTAVIGVMWDGDSGIQSGSAYVYAGAPIGLIFSNSFEESNTSGWSRAVTNTW
jgi:hypothetical protein